MKNKQPMAEAISSQNQMAELLLHLKQCSSFDTLPPPTTTAGKQHQEIPSTQLPWSGGGSPSTNDRYDEPNHPSEGDRPVKVVGSTTCICNVSRKRKLDEVGDCLTPAEVLGHRGMSNEDLTSWMSLSLVKLSCLTPELLTRFERSLKVAQRKSKKVERYKQKLVDKDEEIRQLKEQVKNLKKIAAEKNERLTSKVKHQKEVSVLKTRLQDVEAQLVYKDRLLVEGVIELDSLEELLAAERDRHTAKEQLWVEERRSVNALLVIERNRHSAKERLLVQERRSLEELLVAERDRHSAKEQLLVEERRAAEDSLLAKEKMWVKERQALNDSICSLQSRVEELLVHNRRLEGDRKWLISEGFSHAIDKVHHSDGFLQPNKDSISFALFLGFQYGLKSGYSQSAKGCPIEKLDYYRPGLKGKMHLAFNWLENCRFPYVEKLSSMVDQPLDVIRSLEPENSGARKIKNIHDVINNVDEFLKRESGHVNVGLPPLN